MATYTDNYNLIKPTYAEVADIVPLNNNFEKIDEVMHSSQISLAPAYDQTKEYAAGDTVMYELLMYKCTAPTTGVWDPSKWERTTASESGGGGSAELDILGEASGAVASFADGASAGLAKCIADITPVQDLHGYDKPWAGGAGKNKIDYSLAVYSLSDHGMTYNINNGRVEFSGTPTLNVYIVTKTFSNLPDGNYKIIINTDANFNFQLYETGGIQNLVKNGETSFTMDSTKTGYMIAIRPTANTPTSGYFEIMIINASETYTSFEPYSNICPITPRTEVNITVSATQGGSGEDTQIALGQTVYGGQLNVLTGELTIDRQIVDLGSLTWTRTDNSIIDVGYWFHTNVAGKMATGETINSNYRTAPYKSVTTLVEREGSAVDKVAVEAGGEVGYRIIDSSYTDATAFKTAMNGVQMCYFLATPQTVQLTPQEVNSLLGQNNISADTGDIDIVYVKASAPIQPNPTGTPTATLSKLGIEGTVFEVPSGGGGSSSGINYSTTEKVVGTVEMDNGIIKPLYEKSWWLTIPNQSGGYTFPNTSTADLDQVISNEYSFGGRGMRSYIYWYAGASIVFDEHTSSGISFYFGSNDYSGTKIFYTARYTKITD